MSFNLREHFTKRFDPYTEYNAKIAIVQADEWPDGSPYIEIVFVNENHPGMKHAEKINCNEKSLWLFARLYYAAGHDVDKKDFVIKRLDDAAEHSRNLKGRTVKLGFELNNKGYNRIGVIVRPSESIEGWLSIHRNEAPDPEPKHDDAADLDAVFGGDQEPPAREPGADDDADFPL
jgi:hypothetical protein